ncbi:hypothetical protein GCM10023085_56350 [Actinomadura viridis]
MVVRRITKQPWVTVLLGAGPRRPHPQRQNLGQDRCHVPIMTAAPADQIYLPHRPGTSWKRHWEKAAIGWTAEAPLAQGRPCAPPIDRASAYAAASSPSTSSSISLVM